VTVAVADMSPDNDIQTDPTTSQPIQPEIRFSDDSAHNFNHWIFRTDYSSSTTLTHSSFTSINSLNAFTMVQDTLPRPNPAAQLDGIRRERPAMSPAIFKSRREASPLRRVSFDDGDDDDATAPMDDTPASPAPMMIDLTCYWHSNIAKKFFPPRENESSAEEALNDMISILEAVSNQSQVHTVVANYNKYRYLEDEDRAFVLKQIMYVHAALVFARATFKACTHFSFGRACEEAVQYMTFNYSPENPVKAYVVANWFREFKQARAFPNPKAHLEPLLGLFSAHPGLYARTVVHFKDVSGTPLSAAIDYFFNTILHLASERQGYSSVEFPHRIMADHGLIELHAAAFHEWMASGNYPDVVYGMEY
jgi:hypothetical protein